jgi:hypothetical protein
MPLSHFTLQIFFDSRAWSLIRNKIIQLFSVTDTAMGLISQRPLHYKEMPVIPVNKVVDPKRIIRKREGQGGGDTRGR